MLFSPSCISKSTRKKYSVNERLMGWFSLRCCPRCVGCSHAVWSHLMLIITSLAAILRIILLRILRWSRSPSLYAFLFSLYHLTITFWIVHPKMKILSSFTHLYNFTAVYFSFVRHKDILYCFVHVMWSNVVFHFIYIYIYINYNIVPQNKVSDTGL